MTYRLLPRRDGKYSSLVSVLLIVNYIPFSSLVTVDCMGDIILKERNWFVDRLARAIILVRTGWGY